MTTATTPFSSPLLRVDAPSTARPQVSGLAFAMFLLLTAVLFIRPMEIVRSWAVAPEFLIVVIGCLLTTAGPLLAHLHPRRLAERPVAACVMMLLVAIALSHLQHGYVYGAWSGVKEFSKTLIYFLLLVTVVDSPGRLKRLMRFLGWVVLVVAVLALLHYHGIVRIDSLEALEQRSAADESGEVDSFLRLQATGVFSDPNDFSLALGTALVIFVHEALTNRQLSRLLYMIPIPLIAYAFMLTRSRGGFLSVVTAMTAYLFFKSGWRRALIWLLVLMPIVLALFAGRQTSIDLNDTQDTAQGRMQLWRAGLMLLRHAPLFGIGFDQYAEEVGMAAHNAYVHCFTELGVFGGACFVGALYCTGSALRSVRSAGRSVRADLVERLPCVAAIFFGYLVGMCSLSRQYQLTTYAIVGIAAAFCHIVAGQSLTPASIVEPVSRRLVVRVLLVSVTVLIAFDTFVRFVAA